LGLKWVNPLDYTGGAGETPVRSEVAAENLTQTFKSVTPRGWTSTWSLRVWVEQRNVHVWALDALGAGSAGRRLHGQLTDVRHGWMVLAAACNSSSRLLIRCPQCHEYAFRHQHDQLALTILRIGIDPVN